MVRVINVWGFSFYWWFYLNKINFSKYLKFQLWLISFQSNFKNKHLTFLWYKLILLALHYCLLVLNIDILANSRDVTDLVIVIAGQELYFSFPNIFILLPITSVEILRFFLQLQSWMHAWWFLYFLQWNEVHWSSFFFLFTGFYSPYFFSVLSCIHFINWTFFLNICFLNWFLCFFNCFLCCLILYYEPPTNLLWSHDRIQNTTITWPLLTNQKNLLQVCERIPTIGTQLKILSTVKATMLGAQGSHLYVIILLSNLVYILLNIFST